MATLLELKTQIENANNIGKVNLALKGVLIDENATTYEIMQDIAKIEGGGIGGTVPPKYEGTEEIETLIDNSGVLESTEGTITDKVEQLIEKANKVDVVPYIKTARGLFAYAQSFSSKAVVDLANATDVYQAFSYWNTGTIPIVEELTVKAPNINVSNNQSCMGQMFLYNNGIKKVILKMPDASKYMISTFNVTNIEIVDLEFSTKNIIDYGSVFGNSKKLTEINGTIDFSSATNVNYMFDNCINLTKVTFAPNTLSLSISLYACSKLSAESVQSIIDGLATVETAQTLTLNAYAKILQSQVDSANAKGWTVAGGKVVSEEEYYG